MGLNGTSLGVSLGWVEAGSKCRTDTRIRPSQKKLCRITRSVVCKGGQAQRVCAGRLKPLGGPLGNGVCRPVELKAPDGWLCDLCACWADRNGWMMWARLRGGKERKEGGEGLECKVAKGDSTKPFRRGRGRARGQSGEPRIFPAPRMRYSDTTATSNQGVAHQQRKRRRPTLRQMPKAACLNGLAAWCAGPTATHWHFCRRRLAQRNQPCCSSRVTLRRHMLEWHPRHAYHQPQTSYVQRCYLTCCSLDSLLSVSKVILRL